MKKTTFLLFGALAFTSFATAQTTVFLETFGTTKTSRDVCASVTIPGTAEAGKYDPQKNEQYTDHDWSSDSHVWNAGVAYTPTSVATTNAGACDDSGTTLNIRTNNPSNGVIGNGNLYFNANINNAFTISGVNTSQYENVNLSFSLYGKNKADVTLLKLQFDSGSGLTDIGATQIASLIITKGTWVTVSNLALPSRSNLTLKFSTPSTNPQNMTLGVAQPIEIRIEDIKIIGNATATAVNTINTEKNKIKVFNSAITLEGFTTERVEIYNLQGKKVFTSGIAQTIQPQLEKGLYIIRIGDYKQKISL